jgi:hypothetical protein
MRLVHRAVRAAKGESLAACSAHVFTSICIEYALTRSHFKWFKAKKLVKAQSANIRLNMR